MTLLFKNALVTGGGGFIGSHLAETLVREGVSVTILDNLSTGRYANIEHFRGSVRFVEGDVRDLPLVQRLAKGQDAVFHLAACVSVPMTVAEPVQSAQINEMGTLHVLDAARRCGVPKVVLSSSCAVYGNDPRLPKDETMAPCPESPYAVQKLNAERYAQLYHSLYRVDTVSLRYFNVYGPRQDPSSPYSGVISIFFARALARQAAEIHGNGRQYRDFIYVEDVVRANVAAASESRAAGQVFNIGTGGYVRIADVWEAVERATGFENPPRYTPSRSADIEKSVADIRRASDILNFTPAIGFKEGLQRTLSWFREEMAGKIDP